MATPASDVDDDLLEISSTRQASSPDYESREGSHETQSQTSEPITVDGFGQDAAISREGSQFSDSETSSTADNFRFTGPERAWRKYTEAERALSTSLDQIRAADLSIHLYNVHHLKARHRGKSISNHTQAISSKRKWISLDDKGESLWVPDSQWTAWPLPPEYVPIRGENFGIPRAARASASTLQSATTVSYHLEEEVKAVMSRTAKLRIAARKWADDAESTEDLGSGEPSSSTDEDEKSRRLTASPLAQAFEDPSIMLDDDEMGRILRPTARHILSRLDDLLTVLHKSRQGHVRQIGARTKRQKIDTDSEMSSANDSDDSQLHRSPNHVPSIPDDSQQGFRQTATGSRPSVHTPRLELRDWSEVLGAASIAGWSQDVVDRAAARCARLFEEQMTFRTVPAAATDVAITNSDAEMEQLDSHVDHGAATQISDGSREQSTSKTAVSGRGEAWGPAIDHAATTYFCPLSTCPHSVDPFKKRWRWREHLQRAHNIPKEQFSLHEMRLAEDQGTLGTGLVCPLSSCPREQMPFGQMFRLREHLKRSHGLSNDYIDQMQLEAIGGA